MQARYTRFVVDTNALWWYLKEPNRLSAAADNAFKMVETGEATLIIPAIVFAELYYLSVKQGQTVTPSDLLAYLVGIPEVETPALGWLQLQYLDRLPEIPEMHDRLIAAESIIQGAPLLTRDRLLRQSPNVQTVW